MTERPSVLAGPESAAEHLRNALQLLGDQSATLKGLILRGTTGATDWLLAMRDDVDAARRRVAAALALLETQP